MRTYDERMELFKSSDLYPVVSSEFCNGRNVCEILEEIGSAGAKIVQIREKNLPDKEMLFLVRKCKEITSKYNMLLLVDDRLDIAMAAEADGVHLGQEDLPLPEARKLAPEMIFGVSTHNAGEIRKALEEKCSYLNIGPMFPTNTKSVACGALGLEKILELKDLVTCPFSVMGGIKEQHLADLHSRGFRHIAMVTEITLSPDVAEKVRKLRAILKGAENGG